MNFLSYFPGPVMLRSRLALLAVLSAFALPWFSVGEEPTKLTPAQREASIEALQPFNGLIGGWRGAGLPQRGSTKGAWSEKAEWVWELKKDVVAIRYVVTGGKQVQEGRLAFDPMKEDFILRLTTPEKQTRTYRGKIHEEKLVVESAVDDQGNVHRLTVTQLNEKRTLVLLEQRPEAAERFTRVAEIGYTREGTKLAEEGAGEPVCIVSGGKGTSQVTYKGKTYWVCCTGCRDAFNDDPEGILAQAAEKAKKKAK